MMQNMSKRKNFYNSNFNFADYSQNHYVDDEQDEELEKKFREKNLRDSRKDRRKQKENW